MKPPVYFITGTDTGVGKTVLACLLTAVLRETGVAVAALKPLCSGSRDDARSLRAAAGNVLSLDEVNPWHFRAPVAPLLAARRERRRVTPAEVVAHVSRIRRRFPIVIVEGAGGLLSPLGKDFDSRELITRLRAVPIVVCLNRLGAINQTRLVLAALPRSFVRRAQVVLVSARHPDAARATNRRLLGEFFDRRRIHELKWLPFPGRPERALSHRPVRKTVLALLKRRG